MRLTQKNVLLTSILVGMLSVTQFTNAAISQQINQDAAGLGDSQAGSAASALDASTEFYNPAGLMMIKEQQVIVGSNLVMPTYQFDNAEGGTFNDALFLHYAAPISDQWAFGFGVTSPFAMDSNWSDDSSAAGNATHTSLSTYEISTDLAYAINQKLSVGAGFDFVRVIVSDYDSAENGNTTSLSGRQWNTGWHGGALYQVTEATRVGVAYHSKINYEVTGNASTTDTNDAVLQSANNFVLSSTLPAYTTGSIYYELNPKLAFEASVNYTQWDQADEVTYQNLPTTSGITSQEVQTSTLQNTWRTALGAHYQLTDQVMLRGGAGYETSPYTNVNTVYLGAPTGASYDASAGLQYQYSSAIAFDFGWTHIFYLTQNVNTTNVVNNSTTSGQFSGSNDILGAQVRWDML